MCLRIYSALPLLLAVAACGEEPSPPPPGDMVDCAIGGAAELTQACTLEQVADTQDFVIHHPDGGFRRFTLDAASGAIATFDGAERVTTTSANGGVVQFRVGADRYELVSEPAASPTP